MKVLRYIVAVFMVLWTPTANFFSALCKPPVGTFTELETPIKLERKEDDFVMNKIDIILNGSGLEEAVEMLKNKSREEKISVWMHGGEYTLGNTIELSDIENVTFRAFPGEAVSISACTSVGGWTEGVANGVNVWEADVPSGVRFNTLYRDDTLVPVTRYPQSGYFLVKDCDKSAALFDDTTTPWELTYGDTAFFTGSDIELDSFRNTEDVQLKIMHYWVCERTVLTEYKNGRVAFKQPCSMKIRANDRYFFENVYEALDSPGEWYHDTAEGKLYYVPQEGDDISSTVLSAPTLTMLFRISDAKNIEFRNITFKNTDWSYSEADPELGWMSDKGLIFPQGNLECEGAFDVTRSQGINFINCDFKNIGNGAIRYHREVKNCTITGCTFREIGSNVIFIDGYNTKEESKITENISVTDNLIEGYGRNFPSGIGVLQTYARNCKIVHNEIHDGYYTAVSCGWVWGYGEQITDGNEISENLIYDIGQGWLSDMGGIYTLGIQPNTVIKRNRIYNVAADPNEGGYGGWGIYLDEGSSNILVYQNLVYNCGSNSFHQHYGRDNIIKNNIFALSKEGQVRVSKNENHNELHLMNNIILCDNQLAYASTVQNKFTDSKNLYWDYTNYDRVLSSTSESMDDLSDRCYRTTMDMMGYYCNGVFADPIFRDAKNFDFTLADNSPAITEIGFVPWNYNTAGTITNFG